MTVRDASLPRRLRIVPPRSWQMLSPAELWQYRELLFFFVWRDVKVRYKQTVLGAAWAVLQPLATTALFTVFFGRLNFIIDDTVLNDGADVLTDGTYNTGDVVRQAETGKIQDYVSLIFAGVVVLGLIYLYSLAK